MDLIPGQGSMRGNRSMFFSHINVFLSLSLFLFLKSINISLDEKFFKKQCMEGEEMGRQCVLADVQRSLVMKGSKETDHYLKGYIRVSI